MIAGRMRRYHRIAVRSFLAIALGLACSSSVQAAVRYNLANDYRFYAYSEYRAKRQHDHTLQIKITRDMRPRAEREPSGGTLRATDDTFWVYPVPEMVERILMQEFALSFLFRRVSRKDRESGLILELVLKSFHGHMERVGLVTRLIHGDIALSGRLVHRKSRKTLFTKVYNSQTSVKLKPVTKSGRHMVKQIGRSLEELVPILISDVEQVLERTNSPKKASSASGKKKPKKPKTKPLDLEPLGPK